MKITLIRHGKVNMRWKNWYTSKQFDEDCAKYDIAPICPFEFNKEKLTDDVYISTLSRSRRTAEQLFGDKSFIETELLDEVSLKSFCNCGIPLPLWMWNVVGRLQWMLQNRRQPESKADTLKRAHRLVEELVEKNVDCILVSHGFYMRVLIGELERQGFSVNKRSANIANLAQITAIK